MVYFLLWAFQLKFFFYSSADHSCISKPFVIRNSIKLTPQKLKPQISLPDSSPFLCTHLYTNFPIFFSEQPFPANFIEFDLATHDIILGMDWLRKYSAEILCCERMVRLQSPEGEILVRVSEEQKMKMIFGM